MTSLPALSEEIMLLINNSSTPLVESKGEYNEFYQDPHINRLLNEASAIKEELLTDDQKEQLGYLIGESRKQFMHHVSFESLFLEKMAKQYIPGSEDSLSLYDVIARLDVKNNPVPARIEFAHKCSTLANEIRRAEAGHSSGSDVERLRDDLSYSYAELPMKRENQKDFIIWTESHKSKNPECSSELLHQHHKQMVDTQNVFTSLNMRLILKMMKRYKNQGMSRADLMSCGEIGLMKAVEKWDYKSGFKFASFACTTISGNIHAEIKNKGRLVRMGEVRGAILGASKEAEKKARNNDETYIMTSAESILREGFKPPSSLNMSVGDDNGDTRIDLMADHKIVDPVKTLHIKRIREVMNEVKKELNIKEVYILEERLMADNIKTLQEIADHFSVSRERIRQIESALLPKLRKKDKVWALEYGNEGLSIDKKPICPADKAQSVIAKLQALKN